MLDFSLTEAQLALQATARKFALEKLLPIIHNYDIIGKTPIFAIEEAWKTGIMNLGIPKEYGGKGYGLIEEAIAVEEVAAVCPGMATSIFANSLGEEPIIMCKNEALKKDVLTDLIKNFGLISFATSEPNMGSDVAGMICKAEKDGDGYVLKGKKYWITNAGLAKYITVFANTDPKERHKGICAFLVRTDRPGVKTGRPIEKMGHRTSNTVSVKLDGYRVPKEDVIAEPGEGFKLAMKTFSRTRPIIGAMATGLARSAMEYGLHYVKKRKAFGQKLEEFQGIQFMLAEMFQKVETARLMTWRSAWEADSGRDPLIWASMTKFYASEIALQVASDALQFFGGYGYTKMMPIEKLFRDAKLYQIYEGTTQVQKIILSRFVLNEYKPTVPPLEDIPFKPITEDVKEEIDHLMEPITTKEGVKAWRCRQCGHIHYGPEPPEECPVCHYPKGAFKQV